MKHMYGRSSTIILSIAVLALIIVVLVRGETRAQPIPANASFKQVKELSQGNKPDCLANNEQAQKRVEAVQSPNQMTSFGLTVAGRIIDMPAGYTDDTVASFDNNIARGTVTYSDDNQREFVGELKSFNYELRLGADNNWSMQSLIACD